MADPLTSIGVFPFLCRSAAAGQSTIIAPLHFADDPMQQAGSDDFVLAKLRRDVLKQGIAVGLHYGFGGLHQPVKIVSGQCSRSWSSGVTAIAPPKTRMRQPDFGSQTASPPFVGCTVLTQQGAAGAIFWGPVRVTAFA